MTRCNVGLPRLTRPSFLLFAAFAILCLALPEAARAGATEGGERTGRNILQAGRSREREIAWFRLADMDRREWPEMFSVDQATKKEMIIGGVAQNPWKTLCNSIAECS